MDNNYIRVGGFDAYVGEPGGRWTFRIPEEWREHGGYNVDDLELVERPNRPTMTEKTARASAMDGFIDAYGEA